MDTLFKILSPSPASSVGDIDYWRNFFEELGSSAWAWNLSNDHVEFTTSWLNSMGYGAGDVATGTKWFTLIHPEDAALIRDSTNRCIEGESEHLDIEFRFKKKNGEYRWLNSRAKIFILDDRQKTKYFFGLYTDITEQRENKDNLAALEVRWNKALEGSRLGVWEWNMETGHLYWSPEFYRILNLDNLNFKPNLETWYDLVVPEDREKNRIKLDNYLAGKTQQFHDEHRITCIDGSQKWVLARATITTRSATGEPLRMIGTLDDISERKNQEKSLEMAHERISRVASTIPGFVYEYRIQSDGKQYFPYASEGIREIYNCSPDDVRTDASAVFEAIHPDDILSVSQSIRESMETGKPWQHQYRIQRPNGDIRTIKGSANRRSPLEEDGTAVFFGYIHDITEEVKLARRGEDVAQLVPGAIFQYSTWPDGRHRFPYSTKDMGKYFGVSDAALSENGDIPMRAVHPDDRRSLFDTVKRCGEQGTGWNHEYRVIIDDEVRWHRATTAIVDEESTDGSRTWNGYLNDITETKVAELKVAEQHQLLQKVTKTIPGVIYQYVIAPDNSISLPFLSDGVEEIFGVSRETALSQPESLWTYIHPDDKPHLQDAVGRGQDLNLEYRILIPTIGEQWRQAISTCIASPDGTKTFYAYVMDATARKEDELSLKQKSKAIALANNDLEQFNYVAAHDLKEPLRAIKHLSEWIEEDLPENLSDSVVENLNRMRSRVERLQLLVDDLAAYSRSGRLGHDVSEVNLHDLLRNVTADLEHLDYQIDLDQLENVQFSTVKIALETVFKNLINNAIQHRDEHSSGVIKISSEKNDYFLTCIVEDDGPGIAPEHHERVFKMYQRLNPEKNPRGSGSGLTIVRRILGTAHGTIQLESPISPDGRGSRFVIRWPLNWPSNSI